MLSSPEAPPSRWLRDVASRTGEEEAPPAPKKKKPAQSHREGGASGDDNKRESRRKATGREEPPATTIKGKADAKPPGGRSLRRRHKEPENSF